MSAPELRGSAWATALASCSVLTGMRRDLTAAIKARDRVAVAALRSALAAVENAGAVPPDRLPAATEAPRRHLSELDMGAIVAAEVQERVVAAAEYERLGRPDLAQQVRSEADVLRRYLTDQGLR